MSATSDVLRLMRGWILAGATVTALVVSGCTPQADLLAEARCTTKVLASEPDRERVVSLSPEGLDQLSSDFLEQDESRYESMCDIEGGGGPEEVVIMIDSWFSEGPKGDPARTSAGDYEPYIGHSEVKRIRSLNRGVSGLSAAGEAAVRAPCVLSDGDGKELKGIIVVQLRAPNAPDADSPRQRQNAAGLALSYLKHATRHCTNSPDLPTSLQIPN